MAKYGKCIPFLMVALIAAFEVKLELYQGEPNKGTVLIRFNSTEPYGTICDDDWDLNDANVACKMLGFPGATAAHINSEFGTLINHPYLLDAVNCNGDESTLYDCSRPVSFGIHNCDKSSNEDAGVTCFQGQTTTITQPITLAGCTPNSDIDIVGGPNSAIGRVQVRLGQRWGAVCDDGFDYLAARVVCRALCYGDSHAKPYYNNDVSVNQSVPILIDDLKCVGDEVNLINCTANTTDNDCTYKEHALVSCTDQSENAPTPPSPEVVCKADHMEIAFDRNKYPTLRETHVSPYDVQSGCTAPASTNSTHIYMSLQYSSCAYRTYSNATNIIYSVNVSFHIQPNTLITRSQVYIIPVHCVFDRTQNTSQQFHPVTQIAPPASNTGNFDVEMLIFQDDRFQTAVTSYPFEIVLGSFLNAAVSLSTQDSRLKAIVSDCWATPDSNSSSVTRYPLITNKCPEDSTLSIFHLNQTMFGFRLQSFNFVGNYTSVYLHCQAYICQTSEEKPQCDQTCNPVTRKKRNTLDARGDYPNVVEVQSGRLILPKLRRAGAMQEDIVDQTELGVELHVTISNSNSYLLSSAAVRVQATPAGLAVVILVIAELFCRFI